MTYLYRRMLSSPYGDPAWTIDSGTLKSIRQSNCGETPIGDTGKYGFESWSDHKSTAVHGVLVSYTLFGETSSPRFRWIDRISGYKMSGLDFNENILY